MLRTVIATCSIAILSLASQPALADLSPGEQANQAVQQSMAKAQREKIRNDRIVAEQRRKEKAAKEAKRKKEAKPASGDATKAKK
jgi:hypothetical protein